MQAPTPSGPDPYRIEEALEEAPAGRFYRAIDTRSGTAVTLKRVDRAGFGEQEWRQLLVETRRWARIDRPGLPSVFEVRDQGEVVWIALAPTSATALRRRLERPLSRSLLLRWAEELLDQLAEAHAAGVLHRHISLDSLLVSPDDHALLAGFSLTQRRPDPPENRAPELRRGAAPSAATDLFALAVSLRGIAATLAKDSTVVSDPLELVFKRATADDPGRRYRDAAELQSALRSAIERAVAPPETPTASPPKRRRHHPSVIETGKIDLLALKAAAAATFPEPAEALPAPDPPAPNAEALTVPRGPRRLWAGLLTTAAALLILALWWISRR